MLPGKRLSLQRHKGRTEYWTVIEGEGEITNGQYFDQSYHRFACKLGTQTYIPAGTIHRVANTSTKNPVIIEVQYGDCDEDDIVRIADDFGRT